MKFDSKNIDDVFKDGLGEYSEQPSPGLWKKISSKMFWDDIIHLRFGKIPKAWLGTAAGIAILAVVFSLWIASTVEETETTSMGPEENIGSSDQNQEQSGVNETSSTRAKHDVSIVSSESEQAETESSTSGLNEITSAVDPKDQLIADEPKHQITITPQTGRDMALTDRTDAAAAEAGRDSQASADSPEKQEFGFKQQTTSAPKATEPRKANQNVTVPETEGKESGKAASSSAGVEAVAQGASNSAGGLLNQDSETMEPAESAVEIAENHLSKGERSTFLDGNRSAPLPQKMPETDVLSFVTTSPITGGRRPSERTSGNMAGFMYRGYKPYWTISAYFAPEVTEYYRVASESKENSYLGGVALSYNTEHYVIQAGLEISRFNDLGDYLVNIHSYDSIGYYNGVSGFEVDPENPGELIFQTHTVEVWDTVQHHSHEQTRNSYTYLQIPVMVGYKALESGIFSAHIKAGPSLSILLNHREPGLEFHTSGNARVAGIDNFTAPRIETNVQVLVSLALQMQFNERVGLLVEPTYRYYLNPVYDVNNESLKNPYGIGIRGGVFFNF